MSRIILILLLVAAPLTVVAVDYQQGLQEIDARLNALRIAVEHARKQGLDTSYEEVTLVTARQFLGFISNDMANPDALEKLTAKYQWGEVKQHAAELARAIPGQEMEETRAILDHALSELDRVQRNPASRRSPPLLDSQKPILRGDFWYAGDRPVFPGSFVWMPEEKDLGHAFGRLPSLYLTLKNLTAEGSGLKPEVLSRIQQRVDGWGRSNTVFEVFLDQSPPAWAVNKYPDITQGKRQFVGYDIDHPKVREMWQRYLAEVVPVIKQRADGLATYLLANEPHWFTTKEAWSTGSVSEYTFKHFRAWLALRYHGDLATLNRRWQQQFTSFEAVTMDLPMPTAMKGSALWYDWCRFNMDRVNEWFLFLKTEIRKHDPQARCTVKLITDLWLTTRHEKDNGLDYETLAAQVEDVSGADTAAEAPGDDLFRREKNPAWREKYALGWQVQSMYYDFLKSVAPAKTIFDSEYHAFSAGSWRVPSVAPDYVRAVLWLGHLHGLGMNLAWYWPRHLDGSITAEDGSAFYGSFGMQPLATDAYGRTMKELNAFAPEIVALARAPKPVRLFYSTDSAIQSPSFHKTIAKAYESACFLSLPVGFVTEQMLAADDAAHMKEYPLLIVPGATHVSDRAVDQLKRYAGQGGTVVLLGEKCLAFDQYSQERPGSLLAFVQNAPRVKAEEPVEEIGNQLESLAGQADLQRPVVCRGGDGKIPWGVQCVSARTNGALLVHLINVGKNEKTVLLFSGGKPVGETFDLLRNEKAGAGKISLQPYEMRLLSVAGE
jgi:beta-galactosidase